MNYSKFLSLISGVDRTVDLSNSSNNLELGGSLQMDGSTSGHVVINASATTVTYAMIWPSAQAASSGYVLTNDGTGVLSWSPAAATGVTSVAFADSSSIPIYTVSGSPVTSSGTLAITLANQSANTVFSGPASGSATQPTFRALVSADIPSTIASNTSGTASNITATTNSTLTTLSALTTAGSLAISGSQVSGGTFGAVNGSALTNLSAANISGVLPVGVTGGSGLSIATSQLTGSVSLTTQVSGILPVANGGTGDASFTANQVIIGGTTGTGALAQVVAGTSGQVLTSNGSAAPTWAAAASGSVTSVAFADASTTPIYSISGSPVTSSGTLTQTLTTQSANTVFAGPSTGAAAQPTFRALVSADIPSLSATYVTQSEVGAASGVAPLDGSSKIPASFLPSVVMEYQGAWNPNTNTPALADGTGTNGFVYRVSALDLGTVAGLTDPSMTNFQVGNLVIYSGTLGKWQQAPSADGVTFVNGAQGAIVSTVASANGFTGSYSANVLTMATSVTGILQGNGTAISAATTTGTGSVVQSASPTLTGTVLATNVTLSGALVAPTTEMTAIYGGATTLTANTTYVMRWGMPSNGETAGRLYVADWNTASFDLFWAVGLFNSASSVPTGTTITVVTEGTLTLGSSDTTFGSSDQGRPVYLGSAGAFVPYSTFAPASGDANTKVGIAQTASTIFVSIQVMGVS
jgi:hypothetical protein